MKCKLLKMVRRRYRLVYCDGIYFILDKKKENIVPSSYDWSRSAHKNCVYKMIELAIGESGLKLLIRNRNDRRELRLMKSRYNKLMQFADEHSKNRFI